MNDSKEHKTNISNVSISLPSDRKAFLRTLAQNGYNRSFTMTKMTTILMEVFKRRNEHPGGLYGALNLLTHNMKTHGLDFENWEPKVNIL